MRVHPRLSVNSICSITQSLEDDLAMWQALGVDHVGLILHKVEAAGWDRATRLLREGGVRVSTVAGPVPVPLDTDPGGPERRAEQEVLARAVDFAADVGAGSLYLCSGSARGLTWDAAADAFTTNAGPVAARARERGVALAVEPTNPLRADVSFVFTFCDALDLARDAGMGVVADFQSCWYERGFVARMASDVARVPLVQVSDHVIGSQTTPDRAVPGDGDIPIETMLAAVLDAGYEGPIDLEVIGPRIEAEGYAPAIARSLEAVTSMLERLGA